MPNPLLQALLTRATTPLTTLPSQAGSSISDSLNNHGWGKTGAFAEGLGNTLSGMTSPVSLALGAVGPMLGKAASVFVPKVAAPLGVEAASALKPTLTGLGKLAVPALTRGARVAETLGEMHPDFTPIGGEGMYNLGQAGTKSDMLSKLLAGR